MVQEPIQTPKRTAQTGSDPVWQSWGKNTGGQTQQSFQNMANDSDFPCPRLLRALVERSRLFLHFQGAHALEKKSRSRRHLMAYGLSRLLVVLPPNLQLPCGQGIGFDGVQQGSRMIAVGARQRQQNSGRRPD